MPNIDKMNTLPQRYITETQLEQLTQRNKKSWQRDRITGNGPKFIRAGGKILYDLRDVEEWLEARKFASTSEYRSKESLETMTPHTSAEGNSHV